MDKRLLDLSRSPLLWEELGGQENGKGNGHTPPLTNDERERINEYRVNYQNYRLGSAKGSKGEFTSKAIRRSTQLRRRIAAQRRDVRTFNVKVAIKVTLFNLGAALYIAGSVFFIKSLLKAFPGVGAWLFIIGSFAYTFGAAIDLKTAWYIKRGFDTTRDAVRMIRVVGRYCSDFLI